MANGTNANHPINNLMDVTLDKIRQMTDSNTIIGNPIHTADGTTILPVSKVSIGFASGGSDFVSAKAPKDLFGGGSGAGVSIQPVAFLVMKDGHVRLIQLADHSATVDRALNMLPDVIDKVNAFISAKNKKGKAPPPSSSSAPSPAPAVPQAEPDVVVLDEEEEL